MLSVVIVTLNRCDKLRRCLSSVCAQLEAGDEVIVCNNGSTDGTAAMVRAEFPQVKLMDAARNLGAGSGRNLVAQQAKGDWLLFVDDDEYLPDASAFSRLKQLIAAPFTYDAVVFTLTEPSGAVFTNYIPRFDKQLLSHDSECACLMSGACCIRARVFHALGGFWPLLDPYGYEDRDLMFRFLAAGHCALWTRQIEVVHDKAEDPNLNSQHLRLMPAHHSFVALRHLPWRYVCSYLLFGWGYFFVKALRRGLIVPYLQSLGRFITHVPQVLRLRKPLSAEVIAYCKTHSGRLRY